MANNGCGAVCLRFGEGQDCLQAGRCGEKGRWEYKQGIHNKFVIGKSGNALIRSWFLSIM